MKKLLKFISAGSLLIALSTSFTFGTNAADADPEMETLITKVCEHVVMCMKQEIEQDGEEMSPRMLSMIDSISKQTCQSLKEYTMFVEHSSVTVDDVKGCYKAMATVECGELDSQDEIPACKVISDKLEEY